MTDIITTPLVPDASVVLQEVIQKIKDASPGFKPEETLHQLDTLKVQADVLYADIRAKRDRIYSEVVGNSLSTSLWSKSDAVNTKRLKTKRYKIIRQAHTSKNEITHQFHDIIHQEMMALERRLQEAEAKKTKAQQDDAVANILTGIKNEIQELETQKKQLEQFREENAKDLEQALRLFLDKKVLLGLEESTLVAAENGDLQLGEVRGEGLPQDTKNADGETTLSTVNQMRLNIQAHYLSISKKTSTNAQGNMETTYQVPAYFFEEQAFWLSNRPYTTHGEQVVAFNHIIEDIMTHYASRAQYSFLDIQVGNVNIKEKPELLCKVIAAFQQALMQRLEAQGKQVVDDIAFSAFIVNLDKDLEYLQQKSLSLPKNSKLKHSINAIMNQHDAMQTKYGTLLRQERWSKQAQEEKWKNVTDVSMADILATQNLTLATRQSVLGALESVRMDSLETMATSLGALEDALSVARAAQDDVKLEQQRIHAALEGKSAEQDPGYRLLKDEARQTAAALQELEDVIQKLKVNLKAEKAIEAVLDYSLTTQEQKLATLEPMVRASTDSVAALAAILVARSQALDPASALDILQASAFLNNPADTIKALKQAFAFSPTATTAALSPAYADIQSSTADSHDLADMLITLDEDSVRTALKIDPAITANRVSQNLGAAHTLVLEGLKTKDTSAEMTNIVATDDAKWQAGETHAAAQFVLNDAINVSAKDSAWSKMGGVVQKNAATIANKLDMNQAEVHSTVIAGLEELQAPNISKLYTQHGTEIINKSTATREAAAKILHDPKNSEQAQKAVDAGIALVEPDNIKNIVDQHAGAMASALASPDLSENVKEQAHTAVTNILSTLSDTALLSICGSTIENNIASNPAARAVAAIQLAENQNIAHGHAVFAAGRAQFSGNDAALEALSSNQCFSIINVTDATRRQAAEALLNGDTGATAHTLIKKDLSSVAAFFLENHTERPTDEIGCIKYEILDDGDCGYAAFGVTRQKAFEAISAGLAEESSQRSNISDFLKIPIAELLVQHTGKGEAFVDYLISKEGYGVETLTNPALCDALSMQPEIQQAYLEYDILALDTDANVREQTVKQRWAHAATLQALACATNIDLHLWQTSDENPGTLSPLNTGQNNNNTVAVSGAGSSTRVDLLYGMDHFERLRLQGYNADNLPRRPDNLPLCPTAQQENIIDLQAFFLNNLDKIDDNSWGTSVGLTPAVDRILSNNSRAVANILAQPRNVILAIDPSSFADLKVENFRTLMITEDQLNISINALDPSIKKVFDEAKAATSLDDDGDTFADSNPGAGLSSPRDLEILITILSRYPEEMQRPEHQAILIPAISMALKEKASKAITDNVALRGSIQRDLLRAMLEDDVHFASVSSNDRAILLQEILKSPEVFNTLPKEIRMSLLQEKLRNSDIVEQLKKNPVMTIMLRAVLMELKETEFEQCSQEARYALIATALQEPNTITAITDDAVKVAIFTEIVKDVTQFNKLPAEVREEFFKTIQLEDLKNILQEMVKTPKDYKLLPSEIRLALLKVVLEKPEAIKAINNADLRSEILQAILQDQSNFTALSDETKKSLVTTVLTSRRAFSAIKNEEMRKSILQVVFTDPDIFKTIDDVGVRTEILKVVLRDKNAFEQLTPAVRTSMLSKLFTAQPALLSKIPQEITLSIIIDIIETKRTDPTLKGLLEKAFQRPMSFAANAALQALTPFLAGKEDELREHLEKEPVATLLSMQRVHQQLQNNLEQIKQSETTNQRKAELIVDFPEAVTKWPAAIANDAFFKTARSQWSTYQNDKSNAAKREAAVAAVTVWLERASLSFQSDLYSALERTLDVMDPQHFIQLVDQNAILNQVAKDSAAAAQVEVQTAQRKIIAPSLSIDFAGAKKQQAERVARARFPELLKVRESALTELSKTLTTGCAVGADIAAQAKARDLLATLDPKKLVSMIKALKPELQDQLALCILTGDSDQPTDTAVAKTWLQDEGKVAQALQVLKIDAGNALTPQMLQRFLPQFQLVLQQEKNPIKLLEATSATKANSLKSIDAHPKVMAAQKGKSDRTPEVEKAQQEVMEEVYILYRQDVLRKYLLDMSQGTLQQPIDSAKPVQLIWRGDGTKEQEVIEYSPEEILSAVQQQLVDYEKTFDKMQMNNKNSQSFVQDCLKDTTVGISHRVNAKERLQEGMGHLQLAHYGYRLVEEETGKRFPVDSQTICFNFDKKTPGTLYYRASKGQQGTIDASALNPMPTTAAEVHARCDEILAIISGDPKNTVSLEQQTKVGQAQALLDVLRPNKALGKLMSDDTVEKQQKACDALESEKNKLEQELEAVKKVAHKTLTQARQCAYERLAKDNTSEVGALPGMHPDLLAVKFAEILSSVDGKAAFKEILRNDPVCRDQLAKHLAANQATFGLGIGYAVIAAQLADDAQFDTVFEKMRTKLTTLDALGNAIIEAGLREALQKNLEFISADPTIKNELDSSPEVTDVVDLTDAREAERTRLLAQEATSAIIAARAQYQNAAKTEVISIDDYPAVKAVIQRELTPEVLDKAPAVQQIIKRKINENPVVIAKTKELAETKGKLVTSKQALQATTDLHSTIKASQVTVRERAATLDPKANKLAYQECREQLATRHDSVPPKTPWRDYLLHIEPTKMATTHLSPGHPR